MSPFSLHARQGQSGSQFKSVGRQQDVSKTGDTGRIRRSDFLRQIFAARPHVDSVYAYASG